MKELLFSLFSIYIHQISFSFFGGGSLQRKRKGKTRKGKRKKQTSA